MRPLLRFASTLLATSLTLSLAGAQSPPAPPDRAAAAEHKKTGDEAFRALRYDDAISAYDKAYHAAKDPAILYNRARSHQALGRFPSALADIERFRAEAPADLLGKVPKLDELIAEISAKVASLSVTSNVPGARVLVRGQAVGTAPFSTPVRLNAGKAEVEVLADGHTSFKREVTLAGGGAVTTVDATLLPKDRSGVLVVRSTTAGADVRVDGKPAGQVTVELPVEAGPHRVLVSRDGFADFESTTMVNVGERKEIDIALEKNRPITSKWWFWTGIGAVVVGGTVLTIALLREGPARKGDLPPGQVAAPLLRF